MRLNLKGFKVEVLREAKKLHPGGINPDAITSFQETNRFYGPRWRQTSTVAALSCESDHIFMAPVTAPYRSVSQRYLMGRAKEGGSVGPQPPC